MGGGGLSIAVLALPGATPSPLDDVARRIAVAVHAELRMLLRRKRDTILAGLREESDDWAPGPERTITIAFSDECAAIVAHVARIALLRLREHVEEHLLRAAGYALDLESRWSSPWVPALRAACWGTTRAPGTRTLGGPFVAAKDDDFGWREVVPGSAPVDPAERYAAATGLCGCDVCVATQRTTILTAPPRRSGRDAAIRRAREALDGVSRERVAAVLSDLDRWSWTGAPPAALTALAAELGRAAPAPLELAAMLAVRASA